ncbi:hypothetical protein Psch_03137 [Pelotomaculum schinkii]|uniref:Cyclophilin-like domain-containing protein n=1 Tax=Pelotomaculum schinkii TaxID=78350 RepID=A0A4Y7RAS2_9FIRM|nr:cyclophilin-like fold protein [Pelotomaculum schinkii]TEB06095.1 hypothetical protein Psch_03137 [Pelotomaculum schinkii]
MKNAAALALAFLMVLTLSVCTTEPSGSEQASNIESQNVPSTGESVRTQEPIVSSTGETKNTEIVSKDTKTNETMAIPDQEAMLTITVNNKDFTAAIEDNDTAKAFLAKLPLTLDMSELNGNEKYCYLSDSIRKDTSSCPGTIEAGDIMLYGGNCVVVFYEFVNTTYNYVKIGHISDSGELASALGSGDVTVTFSSRSIN